jgi:hypothetical protein
MCTVTFLPTERGALITSSRDEKVRRARAIPPAQYEVNGCRLLYPKDPEASGSWIAMQENGSMAVLLNGGWKKHEPSYPYRASRGVILLEIASGKDMLEVFSGISLENIEPFTIIIFQLGKLQECRWDGCIKYVNQLSAEIPHIWSSVTLYDEQAIKQRREWFSNWLSGYPEPGMEDIRQFHLSAGNGDSVNDIRMNREGQLLTVSITCTKIVTGKALIRYHDLLEDNPVQKELTFIQLPEIHS